MSKVTKVLGVIVTALGGSTVLNGCGWGDWGWEGFWSGIFTKGMVDNWLIDMIQDWLREDIFS